MKLTSGQPLSDIVQACDRIIEYCNPLSLAEFRQQPHWRDAVAMNFVVIGEALGTLRGHDSDVFSRISNAGNFVGLRHRVAHGYRGIDFDRLWGFSSDDVPRLRDEASALLDEYFTTFGTHPSD